MASTAKRIVLELVSASPEHEGSSAALVACGDLLGISENNVRVTLVRLVAGGTLETSSRGTYRLAASAITRHVTAWRELEKLVRRWDGGWACVQLQPPTDRAAARHRARALKLLGFRTLVRSLDVRPDNLAGGVPALRERLVELGPGRPSIVFPPARLSDHQPARAPWDAGRAPRAAS